MDTLKHEYCEVRVLGNSMNNGGTMLLDNESVGQIRCFVCGKKVDSEQVVVLSLTPEDMVCVCKKHLKYRYPYGTFEAMESETAY